MSVTSTLACYLLARLELGPTLEESFKRLQSNGKLLEPYLQILDWDWWADSEHPIKLLQYEIYYGRKNILLHSHPTQPLLLNSTNSAAKIQGLLLLLVQRHFVNLPFRRCAFFSIRRNGAKEGKQKWTSLVKLI